MAIAAGDEVALKRVLTDKTLAVRGNVLFGLAINTDIDVVWENGQLTEGVPGAELDTIVGDVSGPTRQMVCVFTDSDGSDAFVQPSPSYRCIVVRAYTRQNNGAGATARFFLLRDIQTGQLYEALQAAVQFLPGQ